MRNPMLQYQKQAVLTATPEELIAKLYDLGIQACHRQDRAKVRAVLVELMSSLNFEQGGEIAERLYALYEFCLMEASRGSFTTVREILEGLREAWKPVLQARKRAA